MMYAMDAALLAERPELRVGDKIYPVDNRVMTVKKIQQAAQQITEEDPYAGTETILALALGADAVAELQCDALPAPAYQRLLELVMAAVTGEAPEAARFPVEEAQIAL